MFKNKQIVLCVIYIFLALIFIPTALIYTQRHSPRGDEFHYLLTVTSIVEDHDLSLTNNYRGNDYYPADKINIDKHTIVGRNGGEYLMHGLGLFQLILVPAFALAGRAGTVIFHVLIYLFLCIQIFQLCYKLSNSKILSILITVIFSLGLPLAPYSILLFIEITASLLILLCLRLFLHHKSHTYKYAIIASSLAWLHLRFIPVSIALIIFATLKNYKKQPRSNTIKFIIIPGIIFFSFFIFSYYLFGSIDPTYPVQTWNNGIPPVGNMATNLLNLLIDKQYGLLVINPLYFFIIPGLLLWYKQKRQSFILVSFILISYLPLVLIGNDWSGGYAPPARFLVPILPILIPAIVFYFQQISRKMVAYYLIIFLGAISISAFFINMNTPDNYGFIYPDGVSPFLLKMARFTNPNLYRLFPAYYPDKIITFKHLVWAVCLIISWRYLLIRTNRYHKRRIHD